MHLLDQLIGNPTQKYTLKIEILTDTHYLKLN